MKILIAICYLTLSLVWVAPIYGKTLCTIITDATDGSILMEKGQGCSTRVTPASTTKIPLAVMGFDSGFLKTPHSPSFPFLDGYIDWLPQWKRSTDPTYWLKHSVVWYSQLITHKLGQQSVEQYASDFGFGNADFSGNLGEDDGLDFAWISSSLKISPKEQIAFLERLINQTLPVSSDVFEKVYQSIDTWTTSDGWTIYGKTGAAFPRNLDHSVDWTKEYGWFVGWAHKGDRTFVFTRLIQDGKKEEVSAGIRNRDAFIKEFPIFVD